MYRGTVSSLSPARVMIYADEGGNVDGPVARAAAPH
jgi:hypothetical protein